MGALAAKKAVVQLDVDGTLTDFGEVRSFTIETALGTIDVSTLNTNWKQYLVGQSGWSGSVELFYDPTDSAQSEMADQAMAGEQATFVFMPFGEVQYLLSLDTPTSGTFTLGDGDAIETDAIQYDASASDIQTALRHADAFNNSGIVVAESGDDFLITLPTGMASDLEITTDSLGYAVSGTATCVLQNPVSTWRGNGYVTSWAVAGATEDAIGISLSVQGDGELKLNPED